VRPTALIALAAALGISSNAAAASPPLQTGPLQTAVVDPQSFGGADSAVAFQRVQGAGASAVRLILFWADVAPRGDRPPTGFDAENPADPGYSWASFDRQVVSASAAGLEPIVSIQLAPTWAEEGTVGDPGTRLPDPAALRAFALAAGTRYGGTFEALPRVRYWQVWNEPNHHLFLYPQFEAGRLLAAPWYRQMVNAFADAVHAVHPDNLVIAGGLSPFGSGELASSPLDFMRAVLCMPAEGQTGPTCNTPVDFDVWAHHPYTTGGPTHHAVAPGDVSLGDLPEMRQLLIAAIAAKHVASTRPIRFWVTEFSWDSKPPDPIAVPTALHERWVAEALYRMWEASVSLVTWFQLRDDPLSETQFQSGLYYLEAPPARPFSRPKPSLRAFRFPFVAFTSRNGILTWGRTPGGQPGTVVVQIKRSAGWRTISSVRTNRFGIFRAQLHGPRRGSLRARLLDQTDASVPFSLTRPPDRSPWPFGCGGPLACP
jgi:hypothetical protein